MKKVFLLIVLGMFLCTFVIAQETQEGVNAIATSDEITQAGITPDSPLWGLDIAIEKITERFSENAKLSHAMERLAEVKVMIQQNKADKVQKAIEKYDELKTRLQNQTFVEDREPFVRDIESRIQRSINDKNPLTEEELTALKDSINIQREGKKQGGFFIS